MLLFTATIFSPVFCGVVRTHKDDHDRGLVSSIFDMMTANQELLPGIISDQAEVIDTDKLQDLIKAESLETWAQKLWQAANESTPDVGHPTRQIGTAGHNATLELIFDTLDELSDYYNVEVQPFEVAGFDLGDWSLKSGNTVIKSKPFNYSPSIGLKSSSIHFADGFGCLPSDFTSGADQRGDYTSLDKIVVVKRGQCSYGDKSELAGMAGAAALLVWDPEESETTNVLSGGDLGTPLENQVATLGISPSTAEKLSEGDTLSIEVESSFYKINTVNIIAETKGGDHNNVVFAGAHSDSVRAGPGINDNGSGTLALLEVAKQLSNFEVNNAVRFAWWSAEEEGLKGSLYYTENLTKAQAAKIRLFLDYDMLGSTNYVYEIYDSDDSFSPRGSSKLRDMYKDWYVQHGYNYTLQPFDGRSDYVGFIEIGIPASGVDAGVEEIKTEEDVAKFGGKAGEAYDPCYHSACDDLTNINLESWLVNAKLVAHSVAGYARSLDDFPKANSDFFRQRQSQPRKWLFNELI